MFSGLMSLYKPQGNRQCIHDRRLARLTLKPKQQARLATIPSESAARTRPQPPTPVGRKWEQTSSPGNITYLWTIPRLCRYCTPSKIWRMMSRAFCSVKHFSSMMRLKSSPPSRNSVTMTSESGRSKMSSVLTMCSWSTALRMDDSRSMNLTCRFDDGFLLMTLPQKQTDIRASNRRGKGASKSSIHPISQYLPRTWGAASRQSQNHATRAADNSPATTQHSGPAAKSGGSTTNTKASRQPVNWRTRQSRRLRRNETYLMATISLVTLSQPRNTSP